MNSDHLGHPSELFHHVGLECRKEMECRDRSLGGQTSVC